MGRYSGFKDRVLQPARIKQKPEKTMINYSLRHIGIIHAAILIILIILVLVPIVSAGSSYPPDFGLLPGGPYKGGMSYGVPFFDNTYYPQVNKSTEGTTTRVQGSGWVFEVNDSVWINPATGKPFTSYAAYLQFVDPAFYKTLTSSDIASASQRQASAGYIAFSLAFTRAKFDSLRTISGLKLTWAQFLQIYYPDMYAALPGWAREELAAAQFVNPVAYSITTQETPRSGFIPGFTYSTELLHTVQNFINMDSGESAQLFAVLQGQTPGKVRLPILNTQGTGLPIRTTFDNTSTMIRSRTAKSSGLAGY
jgi:hypothetical protein